MNIEGEKRPKVGSTVTYTISEKKSTMDVIKWAVYRGNLLIAEKKVGTFRFQQNSLEKSYILKAFCLDTLTSHEYTLSVTIKPVAGEPKITKIWWEDCNKRVLSGKNAQVAYLDPIYLVIRTANIPRGDKLEITIFEDEWGKGNGSYDTKMDNVLYAFVNKNGIAELELSTKLLDKFRKKANNNDWIKNDAVHDYYVQIKYDNKINIIEDKSQVKVINKIEKIAPPLKGNRVVTLDDEKIIKFVEFETGTWNVVIIEKYTGSPCEHDSKSKARQSCRRADIKVYDHNNNMVYTFSDALLEGTGGSNRMNKNADTPLGKYKIQMTPFISGGSRASYGPNKRLAFEPIHGQGDEAAISCRSSIRIHGGRQEVEGNWAPITPPVLKRTHGCIRVYDNEALGFYNWWVTYHTNNPTILPGHVFIIGNPNINEEAN